MWCDGYCYKKPCHTQTSQAFCEIWKVTLCNSMDCSLPGSSVHGILQGRILEWLAILLSRESSWPRDQTQVLCTACRFFYPLNHQGRPLVVYTISNHHYCIPSVQFSSVVQLCPILRDPMNHSTPGHPVHHQLLEFTQTHVHQVSDAIQPSHPLSSPSPPSPNPSQHQSLFQWVNSLHEVAKVLEFQL